LGLSIFGKMKAGGGDTPRAVRNQLPSCANEMGFASTVINPLEPLWFRRGVDLAAKPLIRLLVALASP
jgi:hypothetical protein